MSPVLPPEIWVSIVSFVASSLDDADLLSLLTVSRQMHAYAEPELLKDVYLLIEYTKDDSRSPVLQFNRCISAPNEYRRHLVQVLDVHFIEEEPFLSEVQALDQLIPTLTNLRSLSLKFAWYKPSKHDRLRLFDVGIGDLSLRHLDISADETEAETRLNITGLLKSQPSIRHLALSGLITVADDEKLLPQLRSLSSYLNRPLRSLRLDGVVHLSTYFTRQTAPVSRKVVDTVTTLSCSVYETTTFHAFLPTVPNLRYLEIYLKDKANEDLSLLAPLRHTKLTHIRYHAPITWLIEYAHSNDLLVTFFLVASVGIAEEGILSL
ncbi:hypothetical protein ONZ45_g8994 [Pleurotus djamor]|nr:hypothetical protein ONZ45_g8994 [Pleurotus djamor]